MTNEPKLDHVWIYYDTSKEMGDGGPSEGIRNR